jgi:hypothetical protein
VIIGKKGQEVNHSVHNKQDGHGGEGHRNPEDDWKAFHKRLDAAIQAINDHEVSTNPETHDDL